MKPTFPALLVLLRTALSGLVPAHALQQDSIPADVEQSIRARVDNGYNQSIVVGIVDAGGTRFYGYGETAVDSGQAPDRNTVFEIGSISKVFTSLLLAEMVERGEVSLDDPIEKYLPEEVVAPTRNGTSITLRDLATQTSGLPRLPANLVPADPDNPYADYSVQQLYQALSEYTLGRDIGSRYEYSNLGVGLLGHILELRSGMSYDELVQQRISSVLGLEDTRIALTPEMRQRLAPGHSGRLAVKNWDLPTLAGAGALRSDAEDMLRFLAANLGLEQTPLLPAMRLTQQPLAETGSPNLQIGLGWHILDANGKQIIWHNGGTGGYRSFVGFVPGEDRGRGGSDELERGRGRPWLSPVEPCGTAGGSRVHGTAQPVRARPLQGQVRATGGAGVRCHHPAGSTVRRAHRPGQDPAACHFGNGVSHSGGRRPASASTGMSRATSPGWCCTRVDRSRSRSGSHRAPASPLLERSHRFFP